MRVKGILITVIILVSVLFAVVNWQVLAASVPMNFFFFTLPLPLGLVLLAAVVLLSSLFFFISLVDRAGQLRRITHLERQIETLQNKLDKKRIEEFASLEDILNSKVGDLSSKIEGFSNQVESLTSKGMASLESKSEEQFERLEERVLLVRNELAADIAESEDMIKRQLRSSEA